MKKNLVGKDEIEVLWQKQLKSLSVRSPRRVLLISGVPLLFIIIQFLAFSFGRFKVGFNSLPVCVEYVVYMVTGLFVWMCVSEHKLLPCAHQNLRLKAWLYSVFDMATLAFVSLLTLEISFLFLEGVGFWSKALGIIKVSISVLCLLVILVSIVSFAHRSSKNHAVKAGLPGGIKLAMAIPLFLAVFGFTGGAHFSQYGEFRRDWVLLSGLFLMLSFILASLWSQAFFALAIMFNGIFRDGGDKETEELRTENKKPQFEKREALLREIYNWLEPQERLIEFVVGYYTRASSGVVLVLTDKYLRISSVEGGRNVPLEEIRIIDWSDLHAQIRVFTVFSKHPLVFSIWGKERKRRARRLAEMWSHRESLV